MTKHLYHLSLSLLFTLLLCACNSNHHSSYPQSLLLADSLATFGKPDSAIALLNEINPQMAGSSEEVRHYYDLLTIKARDKANLPFESDSLVISTVSYYENGGDFRLLPVAYYYAGRIMSDIGDSPRALEYFHNALNVINSHEYSGIRTSCEKETNNLLGCIYAQSGYILIKQHIYREAMENIKKAYVIDSINNDSISIFYDKFDIGQCYRDLYVYDTAYSYFEEAKKIAVLINDSNKYANTCLQQAIIKSRTGEKESIKDILKNLTNVPNHSIYIKAFLLAKVAENDSAKIYYEEATQKGTLVQKADAHLWLANQLIKYSETEKAIFHLKKHIKLENTIDSLQNAETTALTNSLYNYKLREKENEVLKYRNNSFRLQILFLVGAILFLSMILLLLIYINRKNCLLAHIQEMQLKGLLLQTKSERDRILEENKERILILEQNLINAECENDILKEEREILLLENRQIEIGRLISKENEAKWQSSSANKLIRERIRNNHGLLRGDWSVIEEQFKVYYPELYLQLQGITSYSETEWRVTLLIRVGIRPSDISILLNKSDSAVAAIRRRIYKKVFKTEGTPQKWDDFIMSLL